MHGRGDENAVPDIADVFDDILTPSAVLAFSQRPDVLP